MARFFLLLCLFGSFRAYAGEPVKVFYFGGYASSPEQMRCWEVGAQRNSREGYFFQGIHYPPGAGPDSESAVRLGAAAIRRVADEINAHPEVRYVVAGHSSGAALSNRVAELVKDPSHVYLVALDGFTPSRSLQSRFQSSCWWSVNQNGLQSRNAGAMKANCAVHPVYPDNHCRTQWCLHFVLVIKSTPANLGSDFRTRGYEGCDSNLAWLP